MPCIEQLLINENRKLDENGMPRVAGVDRSRFGQLHAEGRKLIEGWIERATRQIECSNEDSFEPFIFAWIAFNGWASCVTGQDHDRDYLDALTLDADLDRAFKDRLGDSEGNTELSKAAQDFQSLWPIFRSSDVKNAAFSAPDSETRRQRIERYKTIRLESRNPARHKPACAFLHSDRYEDIPLDWPHTLSAIYQVRCNLFHGYKGVHSENDVLVVSSAFKILGRLLPVLVGG
ncbi:MAG: hypothetical protein ABI076_00465 [Acidobacteriaceae bacterium]